MVKFQGLQFVNAVKGGNVPKEYIPSVEKVLEKL
jgi:elongation factor G